MISGPVICSAFIGRAAELGALAEQRVAAARGRGSCVVVSGEAGIGKSRLVAAFRKSLDRRQAAFGFARANEFGNAPYAPLLTALKDLGREPAIPRDSTAAEWLASLTAEFAAACRKRNVVLVFEDVQWADEGSRQALLHLLQSVASMRLFVVVTYRTDAAEERAAESYVARLYRQPATHRIELAPLNAAELREMLASASHDGPPLSPEAVDEVAERSEGNPFFAEELLKSAVERLGAGGVARELPLTIRAAVLERCAILDDATRDVLRGAAIVGRRFDADFLAQVFQKPQSDVLAALVRLRRMQLIDERTGARPRYTFRHALVRDAVYSTMLADEAKPLHEKILRALERSGGNAYDLGYHASAAGDVAGATAYNERAGDEAVALYAYADARVCYHRALVHATAPADRGRLFEKSAVAAGREGKADLAEALFARAAAGYEEAAAVEKLVEIAIAMSSQARRSGSAFRARTILKEFLDRLPADAARARAQLALAVAFTQLDGGCLDEAAQSIESAEAARDTPAYANTLAYAAAIRGDLPALRDALAMYVYRCAASAPALLPDARFNAGFQLCALGIDDEALAAFELLLPELSEKHLASLEVLTCANAALIECRAGRLSRARALIERALAIPEPVTTGPVALAAAGINVALAQHDERLASRFNLTTTFDHAMASGINSTLGRLAGPYAQWLHERGQTGEARVVLRNAMGRITAPFGATETLLAAMELGEATTQQAVLRLLPAIDALAALPLYAATVAHLRALAAQHAGDGSRALEYAKAAAASYRALAWPAHQQRAEALGAAPPTGYGEAVLSAREREIAELVAQGVPNKRLAAQLAVSQRTIEKHLTSIFDKLGLRNRSELTAFVVRRSNGRT